MNATAGLCEAEKQVWLRAMGGEPVAARASQDAETPVTVPLDRTPPLPGSAALFGRRSRPQSVGPLSFADVSALIGGLYRDDGRPVSPTSGDARELTPYLLVVDVTGLEPGLYRCAGRNLVRVCTTDRWRDRVAQRAAVFLGRTTPPPALVLLAVDWTTIIGRYPHMGLVSALWDAGAALQTLYLLAELAGLAGCACAAVPSASDVAQLGWDPWHTAFAGVFAVGRRDHDD